VAAALERAALFWSRPLAQIGNISLSIKFIIKAALFLLLLSLAARKSRALLRRHLLDRIPLDSGQKYAMETAAGYLIFLLGLAIGLDSAGLDLSTLALVGGAVGIGIGLGLQTISNNFVAGLILLFERPVKVGDRVEVGHLVGQVRRIGSRST
jgi:small-conductance mechanosensitive channel